MHNDEQAIVAGILAQATATGHLSQARLMAPSETAAALKNRTGRASKLSGWFLCGQLHPVMWALVCENPKELVQSANIITSRSGNHALLVFQRLRHWHHVFAVPLAGEKVAAFAEDLQSGKLQLSLANGESDDALITPVGCSAKLAQETSTACRQATASARVTISEAGMLAAALLLSDVRSQKPDADVVTDVCVSQLYPEEAAAALAAETSSNSGTTMH